MKAITAIILALGLSSTICAAQDAKKEQLPANVQTQLMALLATNPGVKGALAEAKRWAGGGKCDALQIEESTTNSFTVYATCTNPGDPKEEAKVGVGGQIHVTGTIYYGDKKNAPITIQIDNIRFAYAG